MAINFKIKASHMIKKVLIAEDDRVTLKMISSTVESIGFCAIKCSDGKRAWEVLQDNDDIVLLITDIQMPQMDGRDLIKTIRSHDAFANLNIFVLSGAVKPNEVNDLLLLGASKFISKPIDINHLKDYLMSLK